MRAIVKSKNQSSQVTNLDEPFNYNKSKEIVCIIYLDDKNVIKEVVLKPPPGNKESRHQEEEVSPTFL